MKLWALILATSSVAYAGDTCLVSQLINRDPSNDVQYKYIISAEIVNPTGDGGLHFETKWLWESDRARYLDTTQVISETVAQAQRLFDSGVCKSFEPKSAICVPGQIYTHCTQDGCAQGISNIIAATCPPLKVNRSPKIHCFQNEQGKQICEMR